MKDTDHSEKRCEETTIGELENAVFDAGEAVMNAMGALEESRRRYADAVKRLQEAREGHE